jgi:DNA modification methylase
VSHEHGLIDYAGERIMPAEYRQFKNWRGSQLENRYSHWIWRQYASCFWDDIRIDRVLPHRAAREEEDEKHCHPLQLDVIERALQLYTNPGETVLTPFMGVGSEVYGAVLNSRKAIGIELKRSYYLQACANVQDAEQNRHLVKDDTTVDMFENQEMF